MSCVAILVRFPSYHDKAVGLLPLCFFSCLTLSLLVSLLDDARQLLQLGALVKGDVLPGDDLLLHLGDLVAEGLLVLVNVMVMKVFLYLPRLCSTAISGTEIAAKTERLNAVRTCYANIRLIDNNIRRVPYFLTQTPSVVLAGREDANTHGLGGFPESNVRALQANNANLVGVLSMTRRKALLAESRDRREIWQSLTQHPQPVSNLELNNVVAEIP